MSQAMRLPSVWPINFRYQFEAPATAVHIKMVADFTVEQDFKHLKKQKIVF